MTNPNSLEEAINAMREHHNPEVLQVAVMVKLSKCLLAHYATTNGVDLDGTMKTLDRCVESHLIDRDIHPRHLHAALQALQGAEIAAAHP